MHDESPPAILTLDVEDWEHANFAQLEPRKDAITASVRERRYAMDQNVDRWIETLAQTSAKSTCFVLGEFARRFPDAIKRLDREGHEIATHGDTHDLVYEMSQGQFRDNLHRSLDTLGDLTGRAPLGYRAPSWSVDPVRTPWYLDELRDAGLHYDSSEFPVRLGLYGNSRAPLEPYHQSDILRVPVTVLEGGPLRLPLASGAFFRLWPGWFLRFGLRRAHQRGRPPMIVLHPREIDPEHPRLPLKGLEARIHYARLQSTRPKLESILHLFSWQSIRQYFASKLPPSSSE